MEYVMKTVEFICVACKTAEAIPKDVVEELDLADDEGDPSFPPRFACLTCGQEASMYPKSYKSPIGITYRTVPLSKSRWVQPSNRRVVVYYEPWIG